MLLKRSWNPLVLGHDCIIHEVEDGYSPNQLIWGFNLVFTRPVILLVNGVPTGRADWDKPVTGTCHFVELPRGGGDSNPLQILATVALVAAAAMVPGLLELEGVWAAALSAAILVGGTLLLNYFFPPAKLPTSSIGTPETLYTVSANRNRLRIGEPFAEHFGRFICYPDLAQVSYVSITDNDVYLYFLGIIGVGSYQVDGVFIDKTLMDDYEEASYNILAPSESPTLVPRVVWTSSAISGQDLTLDYLTASVTPAGAFCDFIEFDIVFPQGLIHVGTDGAKHAWSVEIEVYAQLIDEVGDPDESGPLKLLLRKTYTAKTIDPFRSSEKVASPYGRGRYQIQIHRTTPENVDASYLDDIEEVTEEVIAAMEALSEERKNKAITDKCTISGLRGYGGAHPDYGDVTMIECKIKATDQLNGDVASKINVIAQRKLYPVGASAFGGSLAVSRSIIDAAAYIVTSSNGGCQSDSVLDFASLYALRTDLETLGHYFDWRFTSRTTVMDACTKIAKCGRAVPYMPGGVFSIVRDEEQEVASQVYGEDDFSPNTLTLTHNMRTADSPTCVVVNYISPDTWQQESVTCYDDDGSEDIPFDVNFDGCTSRQHAYEYGMYLYLDDKLNRTSVSFNTGLKGHIPQLGDRILVGATMCDWGQTGKVAALRSGYIYLSEEVDYDDEASGKIYVSNTLGAAAGPYTILPTDDPHCHIIGDDLSSWLQTIEDDGTESYSYLFGPTSQDLLSVRMLGIQPISKNEIKIIGNIVYDEVYADPGEVEDYDSGIAAGAYLDSVYLECRIHHLSSNKYTASWAGSATSFKVEVDYGAGYSELQDYYTEYHYSWYSEELSATVKVTPYVDEVLRTDLALTDSITSGDAPTNLARSGSLGDPVTVTWDAVSGANWYDVQIWYDGSLVEDGGSHTASETYSITAAEQTDLGGPWDTFTIKVAGVKNGGNGWITSYASVLIEIDPLSAPENLALSYRSEGSVTLEWDSVTEATGYLVYMGSTSDFDPASGDLVYSGSVASCTVALDMTVTSNRYFKVAAQSAYYTLVGDLTFSSSLLVEPGGDFVLTESGDFVVTESLDLVYTG